MKWFKTNSDEEVPLFWKAYEASFLKRLPDKLEDMRFVVLDTETTGFDYGKDRILSIGALGLQGTQFKVRDTFLVYLQQETHNSKTVQIHGILKDGKEECIPEREALQQLLDFLGNAVLVAHHAMFDIQMINKALNRHGLPNLKNRHLDTSTLYKKTRLRSNLLQQQESYSLDELADKFNISKKDRHTALGDAYITAIAFLKILAKLRKKRGLTLKWLLR